MNTEDTKESEAKESRFRNKVINSILFVVGLISLILGSIGIVLPVLPTTPFLLLSAACFAKSSKKFYNWLMNNRVLGTFIKNYKEGKGMPIKTKIFTLSTLWITILITIFFFVKILWVQIILWIIVIAVSTHIILIRPKNRS
ncbi:hypothetical protein LCGC14_1574120 [marine sediment metagenome]|uniref:DUF454 domain-containing protein n=1 Tax=marine sediment metagenome TaxID=412755 RepID=A0A0F9KZW6_9ZZZZ|nr:DUF454 domain-containing protein [bacterium]